MDLTFQLSITSKNEFNFDRLTQDSHRLKTVLKQSKSTIKRELIFQIKILSKVKKLDYSKKNEKSKRI